jgi:circadian clock protein KaiC
MDSATVSPTVHDVGSGTLPKTRTGIQGLDEITLGGLPRGRTTLVCGGPGCGKTLLGMEFLVRGATEFEEPGVCISFDETAEELSRNVASLGFAVDTLIAAGKLAIDYIYIERSLIEEAGDYDLEGLFVRLALAVESIGAKRVVLDSIETLFAGLSNEAVLRSELRRLFRWLKDRGLTAIVTAERGSGTLTRHGLEEYISDCVILLDHRVWENVFTRRLRIVKYRGSTHGTNEFPFLIDSTGFSVLPITSLELNHPVSHERVSSGVPAIDDMLGGQGYFRGSSILISGKAGTGKTSLAAHFAAAACARGERCTYFSFEESEQQIVRNMRSIGIELDRWIERGLLQFHATRPSTLGLEMHLVKMHAILTRFAPQAVVIDPATALLNTTAEAETKSMVLRLVDILKNQQITALLTTLTEGGSALDQSGLYISSLVDAWLILQEIENSGERNRGIYVLKARGTPHSNQIREFLLTSSGVELREVYLGADGMLMGSARLAQEAKDAAQAELLAQETENRQILRERKRRALEAQIAALQLELESEDQEIDRLAEQQEAQQQSTARDRAAMIRSRSMNVGALEERKATLRNRGGPI